MRSQADGHMCENENKNKVTGDGLEQMAQKISRAVTVCFFDECKAICTAKMLHNEGKRLMREELAVYKRMDVCYLPVVIKLSEALSSDMLHHSEKLMLALTRGYKLVVELMWYKFILDDRQVREPVSDKVTHKIMLTGNKFFDMMPKDTMVDKRMEMRCLVEAAKVFFTTKREFFVTLLQGLGAMHLACLAGRCLKLRWDALMSIVEGYTGSDVAVWYLHQHCLFWLGMCINNVRDWEECVPGVVAFCRKKGGKYAVGLGMMLMNIIKDENKGEELRKRAFFGCGGQGGLVDMLNWEVEGMKKVKRKALKILRFHKKDPFRNARRLAAKFLWKIARSKNEKYNIFRNESIAVMRIRVSKLQSRIGKEMRKEVENDLYKAEKGGEVLYDDVAVTAIISLAK